MDTPTIRILSAISSSLGESTSICQLTQRIKNTYGSAYYANIYQKLQDLKKEGLLSLELIGRSSDIKLNFENYQLIDSLAEMEIEKKRNFISKRNELIPFLTDMDKALSNNCAIRSISSINSLRNIKLNKIELLFLLGGASNYLRETIELCKEMSMLEKKHNLKINNLILDKKDFSDLLTSDEINPLREALSEKIIFSSPQAFWSEIKEIAQRNEIRTIPSETKPLNITELDLTYNLNRFGYKEIGIPYAQGKKFCIEYTITSILLKDDARRTEATAIILAKNKFKSNVLSFLSQKFQTTGRLMGILNVLQKIRPSREIEDSIKLLKTFNEEELPADETSIKQKLVLYNAM
jgi:hypothetical protein